MLSDDILESISKVETYIYGMKCKDFESDSKTIDAVVRNLEIIGEASNRLSDKFRAKNSSIEWEKIMGLRNRIVHAYFGIDLKIIWHILGKDLPALKKKIMTIK
jgi:uncharacterized protein with HEPN domain